MKSIRRPQSRGFTLVELLVVIVIIAAFAALSLTVGPKMMAKAKATESLQNIRQIGPLLTTYAADNSMRLPAAQARVTAADGNTAVLQWNEVCLATLFPDTDAAKFKTKAWWDKNKSFMRNPLFKETSKPRGWTPLNPGYALNEMIAENLLKAQQDGASTDPLTYNVPLSMIPEPERTPLIASYDNWHFRFDDLELKTAKTGTLKDLLIDDKIPVLFVDGHIENIPPSEYTQRELSAMPRIERETGSGS